MSTVAFIPVHSGPDSICQDNIRQIAGRPRIYWTLQAALDSESISRVYVSSDDSQVREVVSRITHPKLTVISPSAHPEAGAASQSPLQLLKKGA